MEVELEHLCMEKGVSLSSFLRTWSQVRTLRTANSRRELRRFLDGQPAIIEEILKRVGNDALIGHAALLHGVRFIITDNVRDFTTWTLLGIQVLSFSDVVRGMGLRPGGSGKTRGAWQRAPRTSTGVIPA